MHLDPERCHRAVAGRDRRFDGCFVVGVTSTGIYCRPSCPAMTPRRENARFLPTPAAAHRAGFRACRRCRPDASPGSPEWNVRADTVGRAMRLIGEGVVDREGVGGLADRLGYTPRHLHRVLVGEVGAGPLALARAHRAQTARVLVETTDLPFARVAFASGFSSVRQFNATIRRVFAATPGQLRGPRAAHAGSRAAAELRATGTPPELTLRLTHREPLDFEAALGFLAARAVPGMEDVPDVEDGGPAYRRTLRLHHGPALVTLDRGGTDHIRCRLRLADLRDLQAAVARCRALLDLDADPDAVLEGLGADTVVGPLVRARPGLRLVGAVDGFEAAVRVILGQHASVASACAAVARLVAAHGTPLASADVPGSAPHRLFPTPEAVAAADPATFGVPGRRAATVAELARRVVAGRIVLDAGADREETDAQLRAVPGIGPWTAGLIRMRALRDPDAEVPGDLGIRRSLAARGVTTDRSAAWRPWRSYALQHLWAVDPATVGRPLPEPLTGTATGRRP